MSQVLALRALGLALLSLIVAAHVFATADVSWSRVGWLTLGFGAHAAGSWAILSMCHARVTAVDLGVVFLAFVQADAMSPRRFGGTGGGLAISQRFCMLLGGSLDIDSELGKKTTVRALIPVLAPDA